MELCVGNLEEFIGKFKEENLNIPWELRLKFFYEIANALVYLHNHNSKRYFAHGDLKPQNILLSYKWKIKLADFGSTAIEKAVGVDTVSIEIPPNMQHTPLYTAPEFFKDPSKRTRAMDIYR